MITVLVGVGQYRIAVLVAGSNPHQAIWRWAGEGPETHCYVSCWVSLPKFATLYYCSNLPNTATLLVQPTKQGCGGRAREGQPQRLLGVVLNPTPGAG